MEDSAAAARGWVGWKKGEVEGSDRSNPNSKGVVGICQPSDLNGRRWMSFCRPAQMVNWLGRPLDIRSAFPPHHALLYY